MIFSIETSCDETSAAIINFQGKLLSHITVNQTNHKKYGGVVPEIASRSHLQILQKIIPETLKKAKTNIKNIDVFCSTCGPGLIGGLLVGSTFAKSLAIGNNKPFYPINHLEGHLLSPKFSFNLRFPNLTLLLTGGHTQIYLVEEIGKYKLLGETIDDAVGECFDKVAKLLNLSYPGGKEIEIKALKGNPNKFILPHPLEFKKELNFSFSGIKTAVNLLVKKQKKLTKKNINDISASFQNKIIEILIKKTNKTLKKLNDKKIFIKDIALVGGVAANKKILDSFKLLCLKQKIRLINPPLEYCSDNAAMIALTCLEKYKKNVKPSINFKANPRWNICNLYKI